MQHKFFHGLDPVFAHVNATIKTVTPKIFQFLDSVIKRLCRDMPATNAAHVNVSNVFASMSILIGRTTSLHKDRDSNPDLVETSITFGNYVGGDFLLPELGVVAAFGPGSFAMFRGRTFLHGVSEWAALKPGDERRCLVSYIDEDVHDSLMSKRTGKPLEHLKPPVQISPRIV